jgi:hypothetical protein
LTGRGMVKKLADAAEFEQAAPVKKLQLCAHPGF